MIFNIENGIFVIVLVVSFQASHESIPPRPQRLLLVVYPLYWILNETYRNVRLAPLGTAVEIIKLTFIVSSW